MFGVLLLLHILAATIWTGGHLILSFIILPKALTAKSPEILLEFESAYEKIGMPALIVQIITGLMLMHRMVSDIRLWFDFSNPLNHIFMLKLTLLAATFSLALNARFRVIPKLNRDSLIIMAWHIRAVTLLSIAFVFVGVSFRAGWFY